MDAAFDRSDNLESTASRPLEPGSGRAEAAHMITPGRCTNHWLIIRTKDGAPETYQVTFHAGFPFIGVYNIQLIKCKWEYRAKNSIVKTSLLSLFLKTQQ